MYQLAFEIGRLHVQFRIDSVQVGRRVGKPCSRAQRSAKDWRTCDYVRELPAHPHDLADVVDPFEILAMADVRLHIFRRHKQSGLARLESGTQDERTVAAEIGIDEEFREPLGLRLGTDKKRYAKHDATETEQQCALAMRQEPQCNVERGP